MDHPWRMEREVSSLFASDLSVESAKRLISNSAFESKVTGKT